MTHTPFEHVAGLRIGVVEFVSPSEIKVGLDLEAPESIALNTGDPRAFPRVNSYVLVPVDDGLVVGQVEWITVERSPFPQRRGMQDFGLVDLPYPTRRLSISPLGTLRTISAGVFSFRRGADALPTVGSAVVLPTIPQLRAIVESGERRRLRIGTSPLAGDAVVAVDPDRLFGRHLAVLGNTGSGKSCSVAGLIRWSLEQAQKLKGSLPNARFIVLDPNGEYSRAFPAKDPLLRSRVFRVKPEAGERQLTVPLWLWNSSEWCAFTQASAKTQRPTLVHALRSVREMEPKDVRSKEHEMRRFLRTVLSVLRIEQNSGSPWGRFPANKSFFEKLEKWRGALEIDLPAHDGEVSQRLEEVVNAMDTVCAPKRAKYPNYDFTKQEVEQVIAVVSAAHSACGGVEEDLIKADVDAPKPFEATALLRAVEASAELFGVSEHVETLLVRIRTLLADPRITSVIDARVELEAWLTEYLGAADGAGGCIAVIDLSLVPTDVVHILTAVVARMLFEALQRYAKLRAEALPTVLVMEEAHTFIKRYREDVDNPDAATVCCQVFERIAREGRKFGLGLVLSSQRPSELSSTVLSQCNTFLLHRISNDQDQERVQRLVPDNLRGLLRELPLLPSRNAILLGWASELPVLVTMDELAKAHQPRSDDPQYWDVWVGKDAAGAAVDRPADWKAVATAWQAGVNAGPKVEGEPR
jgi:hypothetical protein